jgi:hypothetical protein
MVRRPNQPARNQEPALATKARHELIKLSWKEKLGDMPASKRKFSHPCLKVVRGKLLTLKEESCLVGNQVAGKVL